MHRLDFAPTPVSDPLNDLTRRRLLGSFLATAALLAVGACGDDDDPGNEASPSSSVPGTRFVETSEGKITVPADPKRVVCIDYFTAIFLTELGLAPVGGIDYSWVDSTTMYPDYVAALKQLKDIGQITSTDFEAVAALNPDLILGPTPGSRYDNSKGAMETLRSVAPVASVDFGMSGDWRGPFEQTANIINRLDQLAPLKEAYQAAIAAAKEAHASVLSSAVVTVMDYADSGQFAISLPKSGSGVVLEDLGVKFGKATIDDGTNDRMLSVERLDDLADSDIILFRADADGQPISGLPDVFALPTWQSLPAVSKGHIYPVGWLDLCTYRWGELAIKDFATILERYAKDGA